MVCEANHVLTHLIDKMKSTVIPTDEYPSNDIMDAYLDFKAELRNTWLYVGLDVGDSKIGNFKAIKRLLIKLGKAGIRKTWLDIHVKILFDVLIQKLKMTDKK